VHLQTTAILPVPLLTFLIFFNLIIINISFEVYYPHGSSCTDVHLPMACVASPLVHEQAQTTAIFSFLIFFFLNFLSFFIVFHLISQANYVYQPHHPRAPKATGRLPI